MVVIVRDPAAMVASWRRLGWTTDLGELLHQPALLRDWLEPHRAEMEALAAVSVGLLTIYDMCKAVDRGMTMGEVRLVEKRGGKSGTYKAP